MLNPEWFYSLYDVYSRNQFKKRRDKILLKDIVLAKSNFEQSRSRPIHKALPTHIWVATHGLRNTAVEPPKFQHVSSHYGHWKSLLGELK